MDDLENALKPLQIEAENISRINGRKFGKELLQFIDMERSQAYTIGVARALREWSDEILGQPYSESRVMSQDDAERYESNCIRFGKYLGTPIKDIPLDYLQWLADSQNELCAYLRSEIGRKRELSEHD